MSNRWLVDTASGIYIDSVDDLICRSKAVCLVLHLELAGRGQKQAAIRSKSQASKERRKSFAGVETCVLHPYTESVIEFWRWLDGHHRRQRQRRCRGYRSSR